jgi:predicted PP-loop superfamily ATPase
MVMALDSQSRLEGMAVAVAYSGGPDAVALVARLQKAGATVLPVYVDSLRFGA